jgi:chromosome segregation ATPase
MESARPSFSKPANGRSSDLHSLARQLSLAIVKGEQPAGVADQDDVSRQAARMTLETVEHAAEVFRASEQHIRSVAQRAIDELAAAQDRIRILEARVIKAETRAREAEKWLLRLNESIRETLAEWRTDDGISGDGFSTAA